MVKVRITTMTQNGPKAIDMSLSEDTITNKGYKRVEFDQIENTTPEDNTMFVALDIKAQGNDFMQRAAMRIAAMEFIEREGIKNPLKRVEKDAMDNLRVIIFWMPIEKVCKNCKHWSTEQRCVNCEDRSEWGDQKPEESGFAVVGHEYQAWFYTGPEFGCVHWRDKNE